MQLRPGGWGQQAGGVDASTAVSQANGRTITNFVIVEHSTSSHTFHAAHGLQTLSHAAVAQLPNTHYIGTVSNAISYC